jgi:hypothetical protein
MNPAPEVTERTEVRDGMRITWNAPIEMDDGIVLRADVYRPVADGAFYGTRGTGGMTHGDPINRPRDVFGGKVTLHAGAGHDSHLLLPIISSIAASEATARLP